MLVGQACVADTNQCQEVSQYGLDRVCAHFTNECIAEQLIALWEEVLAQDR